MDQLLPYESALNQQLLDLPLPDENMAWADMKRRLDEEEKRRIIPFWFTGCAGWALLGIVLLGLGWWIVRPEKWFTNKQGTEKTSPVNEKTNTTGNDTSFSKTDTTSTKAFNINDTLQNATRIDSINKSPAIDPKKIEKKNTVTGDNLVRIDVKQNEPSKRKRMTDKGETKPPPKKKPVKINDPPVVKEDPIKPKDDTATRISEPVVVKEGTAEIVPVVKAVDSADTKPKIDSVAKKAEADPVAQDKKPKKDSTKKNPLVFSGGFGLHQQLPIAGQQLTPYSSSGRKISLADYIPSIYLRAAKPGKWFLQSEFRYGAPQQTKEFAFRQVATNDTNAQGVHFINTNIYTLKKTFYHQLPLSFNYHITPNWSVGAGMQWNNFYSAVAEREHIQRNLSTQFDTSFGKFIEPIKKDSAREFRKSYWMGILQTQYQWKRFSFGARYSFGLQPYISFTLPGGTLQEEKNSSFQFYILFELWRSRKNKK